MPNYSKLKIIKNQGRPNKNIKKNLNIKVNLIKIKKIPK